MKKKSIVWNLTPNELQSIMDGSSTISEALDKIGYKSSSGNRITLDTAIEKYRVDLTQFKSNYLLFKQNTQTCFKKSEIKLEDAFCENSKCSRKLLKILILRNNLIEYKCKDCDISDYWNGKKITLQLEHINGVNNDNRLENLCFLCPNCHSQTPTWGGRNKS
jgi:hypothetical protein